MLEQGELKGSGGESSVATVRVKAAIQDNIVTRPKEEFVSLSKTRRISTQHCGRGGIFGGDFHECIVFIL